jgi:hypothetical protein
MMLNIPVRDDDGPTDYHAQVSQITLVLATTNLE